MELVFKYLAPSDSHSAYHENKQSHPNSTHHSNSNSNSNSNGGHMTNPGKVIFGKYEVGKLLGRGSTSHVHHARDLTTSRSVAIKCVSKNKILHGGLSANIKREISIMRRLRHPHIVRLHEVLASRHKVYFVMEFVKGGELFSRLESLGRHDESSARLLFRQLVSAIAFCHSRGVFHRDLKPENILIDDFGKLKITDFGLSAVSDQIRQDGLFHTLCGTPAYVAPEILCKKGYHGAKVDVWSCGVILFVLVAGYLPFNDPNLMVMYKRIYRGDYRCPKWVSPELKHLISRLLDTNPATRITVDEILKDPWFRMGPEEDVVTFSEFSEENKKVEDVEDRELNAFDLISFSSGFDLSALFEPAPVRDRFVCDGPVEGVLGRLEKAFLGEEGVGQVGRTGEKGMVGLVLKTRTGGLVAKVEFRRLNRDLVVVETELFGQVWIEKLRPVLGRFAAEPVSI